MIKQKSQILGLWFLIWDLAWTVSAWLGAYYLRFTYEVIPVTKETPEFADCARHIPLLLILAAVAYRLTGQYVIHRFRRLRKEFVAVAVQGDHFAERVQRAFAVFGTHRHRAREAGDNPVQVGDRNRHTFIRVIARFEQQRGAAHLRAGPQTGSVELNAEVQRIRHY